jgi:hypothetical protein
MLCSGQPPKSACSPLVPGRRQCVGSLAGRRAPGPSSCNAEPTHFLQSKFGRSQARGIASSAALCFTTGQGRLAYGRAVCWCNRSNSALLRKKHAAVITTLCVMRRACQRLLLWRPPPPAAARAVADESVAAVPWHWPLHHRPLHQVTHHAEQSLQQRAIVDSNALQACQRP